MLGDDQPQHRGRDYWLRHCTGFRVDSPAGELGTVSEVLSPSLPDRPQALAIALDARPTPLLVVAIEDVEAICPEERWLRLRRAPPTRAKEPTEMNPPTGTAASNAQLVLRAQQGESAAFEELIELYAPRLNRMLTRVL
jgi:hypothetical protein